LNELLHLGGDSVLSGEFARHQASLRTISVRS
jgi:hypothetical protein